MNRFQLISAAALGLAIAAPSFADDTTSVHEQMMAKVRSYQNLQQRGQWINQWMPAATGLASAGASADSHLQAIVAGYTRATLDRSGWHNAFAPADHYAAGEPLLAADVGSGVTSPGADDLPQHPRIAAR